MFTCKKVFALFLVLFLALGSAYAKSEITDYVLMHTPMKLGKKEYIALRSFKNNNQEFFLLVDTKSLKTTILPTNTQGLVKVEPSTSRYSRLLEVYTKEPYNLQNYGLTHLNTNHIYITTDLCPSAKEGYEEGFYKKVISYYKHPVPITIFITGRWIENHEKDLEELLRFQKSGDLDITWGNHTFTHHYTPKLELSKNFVLSEGVDFEQEVIKQEKLLLSYGITPSVLFRFPGLVSDKNVVLTLRNLGLIPVGANAWLAKGERIEDGSIILVHGNKNEPRGIGLSHQLLFEHEQRVPASILDDL